MTTSTNPTATPNTNNFAGTNYPNPNYPGVTNGWNGDVQNTGNGYTPFAHNPFNGFAYNTPFNYGFNPANLNQFPVNAGGWWNFPQATSVFGGWTNPVSQPWFNTAPVSPIWNGIPQGSPFNSFGASFAPQTPWNYGFQNPIQNSFQSVYPQGFNFSTPYSYNASIFNTPVSVGFPGVSNFQNWNPSSWNAQNWNAFPYGSFQNSVNSFSTPTWNNSFGSFVSPFSAIQPGFVTNYCSPFTGNCGSCYSFQNQMNRAA